MDQVDKKPLTLKSIFYVFIFFGIIYVIIYFQENRREKLLEESNSIVAIVISKSSGYKGSNSLYVEYKIKGKIYQPYGIQLDSCTEKFKIGDSVLIRYSLKDPNVVSIIECEKGYVAEK